MERCRTRAVVQVPVPTPTPTPTPTATVAPSSPHAHVTLPRVVAGGGRYVVRLHGLTQPARLEVDGHQVAHGRSAVTRRAPIRPQRLRVRAIGADGFVTPVRRLRVRNLRLAAVGDINFGDGPGTQIDLHGANYPWASVGRSLREADIAFGNLECAVSTRGTQVTPKEFTFRGRPSSLRAAARVGGIDVVNQANNHAGDYGDTALMDTLRYARRDGITVTGAGRDASAAYRPRIVKRLGLRVAFVGFVLIEPFDFHAGPHDPGTAWGFPDRIRSAVARAHRHADVVIATFHWGIEREFTEDAQQVELAHIALKAGATAVIAAHPHVLQPIHRFGRHLIAYSLGNFVFSANSPGTESTGILHVGLAAHRVVSSHLQRATIVNSRPVLNAPRG